ncbi:MULTISPECIES: glycosyltransferase family 4 protein [unclassified Sinorhizobium]|uniref:glycosyltransferase family 4 protein n=1 Tax=unclassified Sinorhizobium TaxID=2613772 RepID=UPI0035253312
MRFAYFVRPHIGGTYTVFKQLRAGLADFGIDVRWLAMGRSETFGDPQWFPEFALGSAVPTDQLPTEREQARALAAALDCEGYDGVFVNVLSGRIETNIARYLPERILRVMIVHNITPGTYAAARSIKDHVHATVGVSDRIRSDLVQVLSFPKDRTFAIPHAADTRFVPDLPRMPGTAGQLRLLFLGRIEDASKGVFWLPEILDKLPPTVRLTVAGDGPDLAALRSKLARHSSRVSILGAAHPNDVPGLLLQHDVMIMPSRFEGFGLTLTEAMAAGCVPVVSRIRGVTDKIVDDGLNGFLFSIGNSEEAASIITNIVAKPEALRSLSNAALRKVRDEFTIDKMASAYATVIEQLGVRPPMIAPPLDIERWALPSGLRPGLRTFLPAPIKNWLRVIRERRQA